MCDPRQASGSLTRPTSDCHRRLPRSTFLSGMSTDAPPRPRPLVALASRKSRLPELETALYTAGYRVVTAHTERDALQQVQTLGPDAVVLDQALGERPYELCR